MNPESAAFYLKQCVDSGLWVPDASKSKNDAEGGDEAQEEENTYSEINESIE